MSQSNEVSEQIQEPSQLMKAYIQSKVINNFQTNCQFTKDLGFTVLRGESNTEQIDILKNSIEGLISFIKIIEEKISEQHT